MNVQEILIRNGYASAPEPNTDISAPLDQTASVLSNLAYYGYVPDKALLKAIQEASSSSLLSWYTDAKSVLTAITGENKNLSEHIVYKNFPKEVVDMKEGEWIFRQILIYHGLPYDFVAQDETVRTPLGDMAKLKVLRHSDDKTLPTIFKDLMGMPNRWSDNQTLWANALVGQTNVIMVDAFAFKENGLTLAAKHFKDREVAMANGTDVLRLCAALSEQDVSLRGTIALRSFKRPERRRILALLDQTKNLIEDTTRHSELWKRLFERLRPGDYKFENVKKAYDDLYNKRTKSFNALIDPKEPHEGMLDIISQRPGEFLRHFHHYYALFGDKTVEAMISVLPKLSSKQLAGFRAYICSINERQTLIYAPKSKWSKAQVSPNNKVKIKDEDVLRLDDAIGKQLGKRIDVLVQKGINLDARTRDIKLQTNDQKLAEYGRGTVFDIPKEMTFLRSASYWHFPDASAIWYDNGWNFFNDDWKSMGHVGWTGQQFDAKAAVMSGDPLSSPSRNKAAQIIDLYIDQLAAKGVRYAVWNILCYSSKKFSEATEVMGTLQMGEDANTGGVYEPSRAQMVFPLKSDELTSYVAYADLKMRKLVYMDAALGGSVHDCSKNSERLERVMPAYVEYLNALPTLYDLLRDGPSGEVPVLYSDKNVDIVSEEAYVFRAENAQNEHKPLSLSYFLNDAD